MSRQLIMSTMPPNDECIFLRFSSLKAPFTLSQPKSAYLFYGNWKRTKTTTHQMFIHLRCLTTTQGQVVSHLSCSICLFDRSLLWWHLPHSSQANITSEVLLIQKSFVLKIRCPSARNFIGVRVRVRFLFFFFCLLKGIFQHLSDCCSCHPTMLLRK